MVTRRNFLRSAALSSFLLGAGELLGCKTKNEKKVSFIGAGPG